MSDNSLRRSEKPIFWPTLGKAAKWLGLILAASSVAAILLQVGAGYQKLLALETATAAMESQLKTKADEASVIQKDDAEWMKAMLNEIRQQNRDMTSSLNRHAADNRSRLDSLDARLQALEKRSIK